MSNSWARHGPRILINGQELQAPSLRLQGPSHKQQASSAIKGTHSKGRILNIESKC